ncbi:unnamed protein product, partial [marine sediment metagenome]
LRWRVKMSDLEEERRQLNKLTQEAFLLAGEIAKAEQEFLEKFHILKKKANKLYEEMDDKLNGD